MRRLLIAMVVGWAGAVAGPATPARADDAVDVYSTPGVHNVGGRQWKTTCGPYSQTRRCRTEIWATLVTVSGGVHTQANGWAFNNLTYLPSPRALWAANPLGRTGSWRGDDGRAWRTECDTALTGAEGCRSFAAASVVQRTGERYAWVRKEVFNNQVRFGTLQPPPPPNEDCRITVDGVSVAVAAAQSTATVVTSRGSYARVTMVERVYGTACDVVTVFRDDGARVGSKGTVPAERRVQDSGTTPAGTFTVTEAFGLRPNPGTTLAWRTPTRRSYWVLDKTSAFYNQLRELGQGGFDPTRDGTERLADYPGQYDLAAVIDFNRHPAVVGRGGAIFLHVGNERATAGCVAISAANMVRFLQNVTPGDTITIR